MKSYFYITIHFTPQYEGVVFEKLSNGFYKNVQNGELYRKRPLYDFGWGQEDGFELLPPLTFPRLIRLLEQPPVRFQKKVLRKYSKGEILQAEVYRNNVYGAVSVIMQDHVVEFIDFLSQKINTVYFENADIRENYKCFSFDSQRVKSEGKIPGGVLTRSYEEVLNQYPKWRNIADEVVRQVYKET